MSVCVCPILNTKMHPSPPPLFLPYMDTLTKPLTPIPRPISTFTPTTSSSIFTPDTPHTGCYRWEATGARWTIWNNYSRNDSWEDSCARGGEGSTLISLLQGIHYTSIYCYRKQWRVDSACCRMKEDIAALFISSSLSLFLLPSAVCHALCRHHTPLSLICPAFLPNHPPLARSLFLLCFSLA